MIIIDGQIGVGKTTLGKALEDVFGIPLYRELSNSDTINILDNFYQDKTRWSFTSQVHFLVHRFQMIKQIHEDGKGTLDRSIFGDSLFAEVLYEEQFMTKEEFNTYKSLLKSMLDLTDPPYLLIYLDCNTDIALERIKMRNRDCEKIISRGYLDKINEKYLAWYKDYNYSPKIMINTNDLNIYKAEDKERLLDSIYEHIKEYI
ncbi:MAG: deoxynucleoside kinase [Gammaproteobacteria bacterium]